jgi:BlaI family penicillinase repressor
MKTLSRREREILEVLYARGRATAAEIQGALESPPGYSAVRALLAILERKGHIRHESDGPRYVYMPRVHHTRARRNALKHVVQTFFRGSVGEAVATLLDKSATTLTPEELDRVEALIKRARREGER